MASSPSSFPATTFPTASTKKMRVRSKSTSAVDDVNEVPPKNENKVVEAVHASLNNGINGAQNGEESLFVKAAKDKHHDRKSRSGRRGLPKKGEQVLAISFAKFSNISTFDIPCFCSAGILTCSRTCTWLRFWIFKRAMVSYQNKSRFMNIAYGAVDLKLCHAAEVSSEFTLTWKIACALFSLTNLA